MLQPYHRLRARKRRVNHCSPFHHHHHYPDSHLLPPFFRASTDNHYIQIDNRTIEAQAILRVDVAPTVSAMTCPIWPAKNRNPALWCRSSRIQERIRLKYAPTRTSGQAKTWRVTSRPVPPFPQQATTIISKGSVLYRDDSLVNPQPGSKEALHLETKRTKPPGPRHLALTLPFSLLSNALVPIHSALGLSLWSYFLTFEGSWATELSLQPLSQCLPSEATNPSRDDLAIDLSCAQSRRNGFPGQHIATAKAH